MDIFFSLIGIVVGVGLIFGGYRIARFVIPMLGFLTGLSLGGAVISTLDSTPFLGSALGIFVGLSFGIMLAFLAILFYYASIIILAGALGYWIGSNIIMFFGFNHGLLSTLVGLGLGIAAGIIALVVNAPKYILIIITSLMGSITTIGSILLAFNQIPLNSFSYHAARTSISSSGLYIAIMLILALIGSYIQVQTTRGYELNSWNLMANEPTSNGHFTSHAGSRHR